MKVLFLVTDDWYFWSHRLYLARAVRDAGGDVVVATSDGQYRADIEGEGFRWREVDFARTFAMQARNVSTLLRISRIYREERPDVIHHVSFLPIFYGSVAARWVKHPAVVNAVTGLGHAFVPNGRFSPLRQVMESCYRFSFAGDGMRVVFQNPDDAELFRSKGIVPSDSVRVVLGSGVDTNRFRPHAEPDGVPVVALCSRMLWSKGVGVLIEAGTILRDRGVDHELWLIGKPHPQNPSSIPEEQLREWNDEGRARWLGYRTDVAEVLRDSHVVCLPTYYREGVPMALLEGAACGRPIVSTDTPGCREVVRHRENGLLVPERDPVRLADALQMLIEKPLLRREMGRRGRELAQERFAKEVVNERMLTVYRELIGRPSSGVPVRSRAPDGESIRPPERRHSVR